MECLAPLGQADAFPLQNVVFQHQSDSLCIENRNSSTGLQMYRQVISTNQRYRHRLSQKAITGVKTSERSPRQSGSKDEVKRANQWPTETSFYEIPIPVEFVRLKIQFEFSL